MRDATLSLGKVFRIPVGLHWSWFLILAFLIVSLSLGSFSGVFSGGPTGLVWMVASVTSILFFISILAHEFGHALVAMRFGIPVQRITLFIMGGIAQIAKEPQTAGQEFKIALAGPLVSLACAVIAGLAAIILRPLSPLSVPAEWLARVNLALVIFNLIPGFPLDGGRVFRSIVWNFTKNYERATHIAGVVSSVIAFGFIAAAPGLPIDPVIP